MFANATSAAGVNTVTGAAASLTTPRARLFGTAPFLTISAP
jgi:hypothetical protein